MPSDGYRATVARSADAWVVRLDAAGRAVELCPPERDPRAALSVCRLHGRGGSVVVAPSRDNADVDYRFDVVAIDDVDDAPRALSALREESSRGPGQRRLRFASASKARVLDVSGPAVVACRVTFDDGRRAERCREAVDQGVGGEVVVDVNAGAWRAVIAPVGGAADAIAAALRQLAATPLDDRTGAPLKNTAQAHRFRLERSGVLRLRASSGVCVVERLDPSPSPQRTLPNVGDAALPAAAGFGDGCDLQLPVQPGTYRVGVRAFADGVLRGHVTWSLTAITALGDGVGPETLAMPGEARFFGVTLKSAGTLGVGVQVDADVLDCAVVDADGRVVADGCQVFQRLPAGAYTIRVRAPDDGPPRVFRPVVFGTQGEETGVPESFLRDFFARVPREPAATSGVRQTEVQP